MDEEEEGEEGRGGRRVIAPSFGFAAGEQRRAKCIYLYL